MTFSSDNLFEIYAMIGPAGVVLVAVALLSLYLILWQLFYMAAVWRNFPPRLFSISSAVRTGACEASTRSAPIRSSASFTKS